MTRNRNKSGTKGKGQGSANQNEIRTAASESESKKRCIDEVAPNSPNTTTTHTPASPTHQGATKDDITEINLQQAHLEGKIFDLEIQLEHQAKQIKCLLDSNQDLNIELGHERSRTQTLSSQINDLEQYSRRNNVRIFGIKDKKDETLQETEQIVRDLLRSKLGLTFGSSEFDICHRIGKFMEGAKRAIIVKFLYRKSKIVTIGNRRKLAKSGISISEDLTHKNVKRLHDIKNLQCVEQAWSRDGRLFAKDNRNFIKEIKPLDLLSEDLFSNRSTTISSASQFTEKQNRTNSSGPVIPTTSHTSVNVSEKKSAGNNSNENNNNQTKVDGKSSNTHTKNIRKSSGHSSNSDAGNSTPKRDGSDRDNKDASHSKKITSPKTSPKKFPFASDAPAIQTDDKVQQQMEFTCTDNTKSKDSAMPTTTIIDKLLQLAESTK